MLRKNFDLFKKKTNKFRCIMIRKREERTKNRIEKNINLDKNLRSVPIKAISQCR